MDLQRNVMVSCLVLISVFVLAMSRNPGVTLQISQAGLNYAAQLAIDQLADDVKGKTIPDLHGEDKVDIGKVQYDITGMTVTSFSRPSTVVVVNPGKGITWSMSGTAVSIHGDWRYKYKKAFIHISDHGSFDASLSGVSLSVGISMGVDTDGRPTIATTSCSCSVGVVSVKLHGGASWLYNLFRHVVESPIKKQLQKVMCDAVNKAVNKNAAASLKRMKVQVPIEGLITLDYRLVDPPVFGPGFVISEHKGEFLWTDHPVEAPFPAGPMPPSPTTPKMVTFCLSNYVMDTLGYIMHANGILNHTLTKNDLPTKDAGYLNTSCTGTCIGSFLPQLGKKYPNGSVELAMRTTIAPTLHTGNGSIHGSFPGEIVFNVRTPDGSVGHAFTIDLQANFTLSIKLTNGHVYAEVPENGFKFHVLKSESDIGPIPDPLLHIALTFAAHHFIIPNLNAVGKMGLELPMIDHVQLLNPELVLNKGVICFTADVKYDPSLKFVSHIF